METVATCVVTYAFFIQLVFGGILVGDDTLYTSDDKLYILNVSNFKPMVSGSNSAWVVEFYNSWCGFCKRFAPTWKDFASDIHAWEGIVSVGVVDCADDNNNPLCREYEVMRYPTIRMFSAKHSGKLGIELQKDTIDNMRHALLDFLEKEQMEGRGSSWPNLNPYRSSDLKNLWKDAQEEVSYVMITFEEPDSYIGREIILDLHKIKFIQVRRATTHNEALSRLLDVSIYPHLSVVNRGLESFALHPEGKTRRNFISAIVSFLESEGVAGLDTKKSFSHTGVVIENIEVKHMDNKMHLHGVHIYYKDIIGALAYSLQHEIPLHSIITGEALAALRNYVKILAKYFPVDSQGEEFLGKIKEWVISTGDPVQGQSFLAKLKTFQDESGFTLPVLQDWKGCRGSKQHFRGYPCSLWQTFHMLTVNSVLKNSHNLENFNSLEVLDAMLGYITNFFGCEDCASHFKQMAAESLHTDVQRAEDSILWLWRSHNKANKRLKGDVTEDPMHPKIQFPPRSACPACVDGNGVWNEIEVLRYLKRIYDPENLIYPPPFSSDDKKIDNNAANEVEGKKVGWDFSFADISLCVVLYITSAAILVLVYIKFILSRRYKKKSFVYDLLGKV
ncbi:hypothetical protein J437_LFUL002357 [Ladona fulva]|uniref:Sulfhydryl oxidase n=1 Tax=Ladona fulva TaxID=123851 RepID=A0A8K0K8E2_LADFU|nr:hypothetical protein J437_LFUL002357 [Ladona fulva]